MAPSAKSIAVSLEASTGEKAQERQHDDDDDDEQDDGEDTPPFNATGRVRSSTALIDRLPSRDHQTHHALRGMSIRPSGAQQSFGVSGSSSSRPTLRDA
jgi:hypothetical protein